MRGKNTLERMIEAGEFSIDLNGHSPFGTFRGVVIPLDEMQEAQILESLQMFAYRDGVLLGMAIAGQGTATFDTTMGCCECGESLQFSVAGKIVKVASACEYPQGVQFPLRATIEVPSGRLAFTDKFTFLTDPCSSKDASSMSMGAAKNKFQAWAASGFPSAGCGNSCPSIYRVGDSLVISSDPAEEGRIPEGAQELGSICTDYWSWHCGDFEKLQSEAASAGEKLRTSVVVELKPGLYEVVVHSIHGEHRGRTFATIAPVA